MTVSQRINASWERDGLSGIFQRSTLYLLRRIAWRTDGWSRNLDHHLAERAVQRNYGSLLKRNEIFRDRHKGSRCFVIGNGPSLKDQDLSPLADEITLVSNYFHRHSVIGESWQPKYYFLTDPMYFDGREPIEWIREIVSTIPAAPFFVPHHAREFIDTNHLLPKDRTYYVGMCTGKEDEWSALPDFTTAIPGVQTVVQLAIMAGMFMGCSTIYLMGLDHNWLSHGGVGINFYSKEEVKDQPQGNVEGWDYKSLMLAMTTMWHVYELLQRIARTHGIKIINVTRGGFLDVFERADYEKVIEDKLVTSF